MFLGLGFRVKGLRYMVVRVKGVKFMLYVSEFMVHGLGCIV